jgi:hypothetical protein
MTNQPRRVPLHIAAAICAAVLTAGCSAQTVTENTGEGAQVTEDASTPGSEESTKEPAEAAGEATLKKTGFGRDGDYGWVSAIVTNSSSENVGRFVTVQFNLLDSDGELVTSAEQIESFTSADQTLALGTQVDMVGKGKVAKVEATLGLGDTLNTEDLPNLPVGKVKVKVTEYVGTQAVFEVKNPTDTAQKQARIGIACFNKDGKIIGGGSDYPELIPANGRVLVEASVLTDGKPSKCEAYASPSSF